MAGTIRRCQSRVSWGNPPTKKSQTRALSSLPQEDDSETLRSMNHVVRNISVEDNILRWANNPTAGNRDWAASPQGVKNVAAERAALSAKSKFVFKLLYEITGIPT